MEIDVFSLIDLSLMSSTYLANLVGRGFQVGQLFQENRAIHLGLDLLLVPFLKNSHLFISFHSNGKSSIKNTLVQLGQDLLLNLSGQTNPHFRETHVGLSVPIITGRKKRIKSRYKHHQNLPRTCNPGKPGKPRFPFSAKHFGWQQPCDAVQFFCGGPCAPRTVSINS